MNIIFTRPIIDSEDLMENIFKSGHKIIHLPTLDISSNNMSPLDTKNYHGLVFTSTNAVRFLKLKHDGLKQAQFFRSLVTAYIAGDERIQSYLDEVSSLSKERRSKSKKLRDIGKQKVSDFGFTDGELDNIFDLIEEEHPEL